MRFEKSYGNWLPDGPNSVRFYLTTWDMACMLNSFCGYIMHIVTDQLEPLSFIVCLLLGSTLENAIIQIPNKISGAAVAQWLAYWPCNPRASGLILSSSSHLRWDYKPRSRLHDLVVHHHQTNVSSQLWQSWNWSRPSKDIWKINTFWWLTNVI